MTKEFNSLDEIQKYYDVKSNAYVFKEDGTIIPFTQLSNFIAFEIINRLKSLENTSCAMCDYFMSECNGGCFSYKFKH